MFKKIKYDVAENDAYVTTREGKNIRLDEAIELLSNPNVLSFTATRMTVNAFFKKKNKLNIT